MKYEDMDIPAYYEEKRIEHEELVGCYAPMLVIVGHKS